MGILQEAENKIIGFKVKLDNQKSGLSSTLSFPDPDAQDRGDLEKAKQIAGEITKEWALDHQKLGRTGDVRIGKAQVSFSRNGVEKVQLEE